MIAKHQRNSQVAEMSGCMQCCFFWEVAVFLSPVDKDNDGIHTMLKKGMNSADGIKGYVKESTNATVSIIIHCRYRFSLMEKPQVDLD